MDVFRHFRPFGERNSEDRPEKRREQLRRAQKTYRQRRDHYTKSLEDEVARLQARETTLLQEAQQLRHTIYNLESLVASCGIQTDLTIGLARGTENEELDSVLPSGLLREDVCSPGWQDDSQLLPQHNSPLDNCHISATPDTSRHSNPGPGDLDPTTAGMEFVLALESPCLGHIHGDPKNPAHPGGHALTVTSHLLAISPSSLSSTQSSPDSKVLHDECAKAPTAILDRLLALSNSLVNEGEVTPVQAWNRIRCEPLFGRLQASELRALTKRLVEAVKCHGFGAVVRGNVFEKLLGEALAGCKAKYGLV